MSEEKTDKPKTKPHEGQRIAFLRFVSDLPVPGDQVSHVNCGAEATPHNRSYVCTYHAGAAMYELNCFTNGAHHKELWIPRERVAYHEVLKLDADAAAKRKEPW